MRSLWFCLVFLKIDWMFLWVCLLFVATGEICLLHTACWVHSYLNASVPLAAAPYWFALSWTMLQNIRWCRAEYSKIIIICCVTSYVLDVSGLITWLRMQTCDAVFNWLFQIKLNHIWQMKPIKLHVKTGIKKILSISSLYMLLAQTSSNRSDSFA